MHLEDRRQKDQAVSSSSHSSSRAESNRSEIASDVEAVNEGGIYRFVQIGGQADRNGSNQASPWPSLQPTTELYSRSLNDVSSLMSVVQPKDSDSQASIKTHMYSLAGGGNANRETRSQSEILYMPRHRQPQSQPLTPPGLRHRLLKKIRPKRPWETGHSHGENCATTMSSSLSQVGQSRRRERDSTQIHTSSDDEDASSHSAVEQATQMIGKEHRPGESAADATSTASQVPSGRLLVDDHGVVHAHTCQQPTH
ncbi:hypothetical protein PWT90_05710 [Aphanocladium album]|nr:hypothetical protein PWT90_05710 [Aphanocladium album]